MIRCSTIFDIFKQAFDRLEVITHFGNNGN